MTRTDMKSAVEALWDRREGLDVNAGGADRALVADALNLLDSGEARVAERSPDGTWVVHEWLKKAVLLSFRLNPMTPIKGAPGQDANWFDKVPSKFEGWGQAEFETAGFRAVPDCVVRHSAFVGKGAVLMPCFVNLGAYVGAGTMVDTWATVGSCAQVGANCHISGGAGIGGVLEPLQATPVIIEDNCFIGARSEVAEGVIVREGAVLSMGVYLSASTKIIDRHTGEVHRGEVPPFAVVVPGSTGGGEGKPATYCAVIVKTVDERTRSKTSINELLREA